MGIFKAIDTRWHIVFQKMETVDIPTSSVWDNCWF